MTAPQLIRILRIIKDWSTRQLLYLILILACCAGVILSILFGPGKGVPEFTPITIAVGFLLLIFECLYVREMRKGKKRPITARWVISAMIILGAALILQGVVLLIASILWPIVLPLLGIYILVLLFVLWAKSRNESR